MSKSTGIGGKTTKKDDVNLSTILDASQRAELTLLVANITQSMRTLLEENFEATAGLDKSFSRVEDMTEDEKLMTADPGSANVEEMDRQRKLKEDNEKDLASLKMKNLKKNSLKSYDEWREQLMARVGEVVNSRETVSKQVEEGKPQQPKPDAPTTVGIIKETPDRGTSLKFKDLYQPTKNPLTKLSMDQRALILHSMLLLVISLEQYSAPSRVLMLLLTSSLKLPLKTFEQDELVTAKGLLEGAKELSAEEETKKKVEENKDSRKWKVGLATAAGAAIIGVTGGLAAPLVAAGVGSVMGGLGLGATSAATYLGSVAGSTYLVGGLFGAYGGRMTGNMMDNYAREVEDFEFIPVHSNKKTSEDEKKGVKQASEHGHKLRVTIGISGWLTEKEEAVQPWRVLGTSAEVFALKYELEAMLNLGNAMKGFVQSAAWGYAKKQVIMQTIFADLAAAMWPIGLLRAARVIDNPFNIAKSRSEKAGEVLADALINKAQGERPVTLIGYSLGARVIYACLMSLAKRKAFGLIENAILVGSPTPSDTSNWRTLRAVVSGRLVNVYSTNDYVLGFMYRTSSLQYGVAGLEAVQGLSGVENVDVSEEVSGHLRYRYLMGSILKKIGFEDVDMQAVEEEIQALAKMEEEEKKNSLDAQRKRLLRRQNSGREDEAEEAELEATEIEKEVQARTQKSMLTRAIEYFYTPKVPGAEGVQNTAAAVQTAAQDPSQAVDTAKDTAKDVQVKTQPPSQQASRDTGSFTQTYAARAAGYLPSMPKSLSSMAGMSGRDKTEVQEQPRTEQAAKDASRVGQKTAGGVADTADQTIRPTLENTLNPQDNPAVKAVRGSSKRTPIIHQPAPPDVTEKVKGVASSAKTATQSAGQSASQPAQTATSEVVEKGRTTASSMAGSRSKNEHPSQSYAQYAASYLPSMPKSIPGWTSGRKPPVKLERRSDGASGVQKPPSPSLQRRTNSGIKSPPPKLGPSRTNSGMKSPT